MVHRVLAEMRAARMTPDALTVAIAVAALARGCGRLDEAEAVLRATTSREEEDGEGQRGVGAGPPSLLAYHALMLAAIEQEQEQGAGGGGDAGERCGVLLSAMVERHGLCPSPVTYALLVRARCDPEALALAKALHGPWKVDWKRPLKARFSRPGDEVGKEEEEVEDEEEEGDVLSFEAARARIEKALTLNPHCTRLRVLCIARSGV